MKVDHIKNWNQYTFSSSSYKYLNSKTKRIIDIFGALIGIVLGCPIFGLAAFLVKVIDHVPVLFIQERVGKDGKSFKFYKLRTLQQINNREEVEVKRLHIKPTYDTTRTGKFWRVNSIDEIIQFCLVLKGEMSLIGYRPIPAYYLPHLHKMPNVDAQKLDHYFKVVNQYKPGMSSLSSVNGRGDLTMPEKFIFDLKYAQEATIWYDIKLLLQTIVVVITHRGAK